MKLSHAIVMGALGVASTLSACGIDGTSSTEPTAPTPRQAQTSTGSDTSEGDSEKEKTQAAQSAHAQRQSSSQWPEHKADELNALAPDDAKILASATGDLNGDGKPDALVVLDSSKSDNPRTVVLLIRDTDGFLRENARNDKIVPCSKCGGILGDPFGYMRIDNDGFVIVIEGGSRWRWSSEYAFEHAVKIDDWHLQKVDRRVYDSISQDNVSKTFTPDDFGKVSFSEFDPETIPEVVLP